MIQYKQKIEAIVIGASAGGIDALEIILTSLPESFSLPIIVVLHLPPDDPSILPQVFSHKIKMKVLEANEKELLNAGTVYFAPPAHHLLIEKNKTFSLTVESPVFFSRPSIDILFKSAADVYGKALVGILLTGANQDGALGLKKIKEIGGTTIVQNPISAEVSMMPESGMPYASDEGVLTLTEIADYLLGINQTSKDFIKLPFEENVMLKANNVDKFEILIVDDVKENLIALNALLQRDDVEIYKALCGNEALELMIKHDFCLALLDVRMPGMNGFELAELMRGTNHTKNIPIIFVTADTKNQTHLFKGYETGAVDFLRKPLDPHAVKSKVNVFLELHSQKKELKKQVKELKQTRVELEQAIRAREEFMAIASHELRTPITVLKLQTQLRKHNIEKGNESAFTSDKLAKMFDSDNKQLERLNRLIDDMLDVSRISSGKLSMSFELFDIGCLVQEVIDRNLELLKDAGIDVKINIDEIIQGRWDKLRIEQVINNLITNVIRYGAGNPVEITVSTKTNHVIIIIKDQGIGIEKEDLKRIFLRFERVTGKEISGLGLGLYIVSQIIEAHNGTINVTSSIGLGSEFTIQLPLNL